MHPHSIRVQGLEISYAGTRSMAISSLFEAIDFKASGQDDIMLIAPNGTGKTSLLKLISGDASAASISSGQVIYQFKGKKHWRCPNEEGYAAFAGLAAVDYVSEFLDFLKLKTVLASGRTRNYYYAGKLSGILLERVHDFAQRFSLDHMLEAPFSNLSSGQKMLALLARALIAEPQLLVLDEVDQYLSPSNIALVKTMLMKLKSENSNLIILAAAHQIDRCGDLYKEFDHVVLQPKATRDIEVVKGPGVKLRYPLNRHITLNIEKAFIRFGLDDVWQLNVESLSIKSGECWYISGENGAGKTTLLKAMAGKVPFHADSKVVELNNSPIHYTLRHDAPVRIRYCGGFLSDNRIEDVPETESTLYEYLAGAEQGVHAIYAEPKPISARTMEWLDLAQLTPFLNEPIKSLSSGQRKRFELVAAIGADAGVVLFDEPFNNLDEPSTKLLIDAFGLLKSDGRAIVLTAHDLPKKMEEIITNSASVKGNCLVLET